MKFELTYKRDKFPEYQYSTPVLMYETIEAESFSDAEAKSNSPERIPRSFRLIGIHRMSDA